MNSNDYEIGINGVRNGLGRIRYKRKSNWILNEASFMNEDFVRNLNELNEDLNAVKCDNGWIKFKQEYVRVGNINVFYFIKFDDYIFLKLYLRLFKRD